MLATALALTLCAAPSLEDVFAKVDGSVVTVRVGLKTEEKSEDHALFEVSIGTGAGVLVHADGLVVTAAHVVEDAEVIEVHYRDGSAAEAHIVTLSRTEDIALLKAEKVPKGAVVAVLGDSDALKQGQRVFAVGAPMGLEHTLTAGIVSALRTNPPRGLQPHRVIQTDVALNQGNSGGPLFSDSGEVVGIASYMLSRSGGSVGLNFAVPSNSVRARLFEQALPWIGVSLRVIPKDVAELFNWPSAGILVEKVRPGSVAEKAGLKGGQVRASVGGSEVWLGGDFIVRVGGVDAEDGVKVARHLRSLKTGDAIHYEVLRAGAVVAVDVPVPEAVAIPALTKPRAR